MAGFIYFKDSPIIGEATQGSCAGFSSPNGMGNEDFYVGWIPVHSVTQSVARAIETGHGGTARSRAGTILEEMEVEKEVDRTSTELLRACSGGTTFPEVFVHICTSVVDQDDIPALHPFLEFHLYSVKVTRYQITCSGLDDGAIPTETLSLNFEKVVWTYWPIGPTPEKPEVSGNFIHDKTLSGWDVLRSAPFTD
jgi:type VI protein secretion system component Hcp